jgi:hypothetical protein
MIIKFGLKNLVMEFNLYKEYVDMDYKVKDFNFNSNIIFLSLINKFFLPMEFLIHTPN